MARAFAEIAFSPSVRKMQKANRSDEVYGEFLSAEAVAADRIGPMEAQFISNMDGFYQATVGANGWPYVQFRGGPRGFLKIIDDQTIGYADFRGNRQYISAGNLADDPRVSIILMDYPNRRRLKIWGKAHLISLADDPELLTQLKPEAYRALPERMVRITVVALDWNCPSHIPQRLTWEEMEPSLAAFRRELDQLRDENEELKQQISESFDTDIDGKHKPQG